MPAVISRAEARTLGLTLYFTGRACKRGHIVERSVSEGKCYACIRFRNRKYRVANPERHKEKARNHRKAHPEKYKKYYRTRLENHPEQVRGHTKRWRAVLSANPHSPENSIKTARHMLSTSRSRSKKKGLEFSISPKDILPLPTHCPIMGNELIYFAPITSGPKLDNRASLDRIDNKRGYVPGNVRIISWRANHIKTDATVDELRKVLIYCEMHEAFPF